MRQKKIFLESEGDLYFERNKNFVSKNLDYYSKKIFQILRNGKNNKILEIGCGKGELLNKLSKKKNYKLYGIDHVGRAHSRSTCIPAKVHNLTACIGLNVKPANAGRSLRAQKPQFTTTCTGRACLRWKNFRALRSPVRVQCVLQRKYKTKSGCKSANEITRNAENENTKK